MASNVMIAKSDPLWSRVMEDELSALHKTKIWKLVPLDSTQNVLLCKWYFKLK